MVFKIFKRSKVPDELPELASDKIGGFFNEEGKIVHKYLEEEESKNKPALAFPEIEKPTLQKKDLKEEIKEDVSQKKDLIKGSLDNEKSFFSDLQENLSSEMNDLDQLENWYTKKFLPRDVVSDMRGYWEKQKTNSIIKVLGKNFQEKISVKVNHLQSLEKEWQNIYFDLIEKEEEIKDEEKELKELLAEFVKICKKKSRDQGKK